MASIIEPLQSIAAFASASLPNQTTVYDVPEFDSRVFEGKARLGYALLFLFIVVIRLAFRHKSPKVLSASRLPPGPKSLPLIGSVFEFLEARRDPAKFMQFSQKVASYGEMATMRMGTRTWVFLNSNRVVKEIIAKQAAVTGDRPDFPVSGGLVSQDNRTVLKKTSRWQEGRKIMHHLLNGTALRTYGQIQEEESTRLLHGYLHTPQQWFRHHYDYPYSIIHRIVLGERPQQTKKELDEFRRITVEFILSISSTIFDFWPRLGIFQPFRNFWLKMGDDHNNVLKAWWEPVRRDIANGVAPPSFVRDVLLKSNTKIAKNNEEAMYLATSIVAAGSDNVRRAHNVLMMAAICHPSVVEKARKEIDSVCGDAQRLPGISDMESLPYVSAIIKESLRWRPVVPLIPPHYSTKPVHFEGYTFPAGTDFVVNSCAVANDVDGPQEFYPERWANKEINITEDLWAFGGGRRVCVGYKIAHQELFLALARMIYCFDVNADGPVDSRRLGHHLVEAPFSLKITPRSEAHSELIEASNAKISH